MLEEMTKPVEDLPPVEVDRGLKAETAKIGAVPRWLPRPDLNGQIVAPAVMGTPVYLMEGGVKRLIPDTATFNNLFINGAIITPIAGAELLDIPNGIPITAGAILASPINPLVEVIYLLENHCKRWVSDSAMSKYQFDPGKVQKIDPILLEFIIPGLPIV